MTEEYNPYLRSDDQQPKAAPFAQPTPAPSAPDPQPPFQRTAARFMPMVNKMRNELTKNFC